jgi:formylmethanofuran dehydrogenase subunit D
MSLQLTLIVARTHDQELTAKTGTVTDEYKKAAAAAFLSKSDLNRLGLKSGENIEVSFMGSSIVVKAFESDEVREGMILIPLGPWAMAVLPSFTGQHGFPVYGRVTVTVKPSVREVSNLKELFTTF